MTTRYTNAEMRQRAVLIARGSRQALAGADVDPRIDRRIERIDQAATDRYARESAAALRLLDQAKEAAAAARAAYRAAGRTERHQAKQDLKKAEDALRRAEKAAAPYLDRP